jgi:hypothetical protein
MAVTTMSQPDFRTIAKSRRRHLKALGTLFVQVFKLCRAAGGACSGDKIRCVWNKRSI